MKTTFSPLPLIWTASAAVLALAVASSTAAQETDAQARARAATQALNGGPAESSLGATRTQPAPVVRQGAPRESSRQTRDLNRTLEDLLGSIEEAPAETASSSRAAVTLAPGESAPPPIPVALGYYVRGDVDCDQVWPGEGNIAFMTPSAFTIDFGGCRQGQFLQTGPNSWREEQSCQTELGDDAGVYIVDYEMVETGVMRRRAYFELDDALEEDNWRFCEMADVPENARFASDSL